MEKDQSNVVPLPERKDNGDLSKDVFAVVEQTIESLEERCEASVGDTVRSNLGGVTGFRAGPVS